MFLCLFQFFMNSNLDFLQVIEKNTIYPISLEETKSLYDIDDKILLEYIDNAYHLIQNHLKWTLCPTKYSYKVNWHKLYIERNYLITEPLIFCPIIKINKINAISILDEILEFTDYKITPSNRILISGIDIAQFNITQTRPVTIEYEAGYINWEINNQHMYPHSIVKQLMLDILKEQIENNVILKDLEDMHKQKLITIRNLMF